MLFDLFHLLGVVGLTKSKGFFKIAFTVGLRLGTTWRQSVMSFLSPALKLVDTGVNWPRTIFMDSM